MTTIDKTGASDAEFRARVAAFDAAPTSPECDPERVAPVARALWEQPVTPSWRSRGVHGEAGGFYGLSHADARRLAAVAIAADPSPAEEAVKRVEALCDVAEQQRFVLGIPVAELRAALASPAPAPQGDS